MADQSCLEEHARSTLTDGLGDVDQGRRSRGSSLGSASATVVALLNVAAETHNLLKC